jgi:hypothetical protein
MAEFRYRGREIRQEDILSIRRLIERYPKESRRKLSVILCEARQWRGEQAGQTPAAPQPVLIDRLEA